MNEETMQLLKGTLLDAAINFAKSYFASPIQGNMQPESEAQDNAFSQREECSATPTDEWTQQENSESVSGYENASSFKKKLFNDIVGDLKENPPTASSLQELEVELAIRAVIIMGKSLIEVNKFAEIQETQRAAIYAETVQICKEMDVYRDLVLNYMDKAYDERRENFKQLFQVLDAARTSGNIEQMNTILQGIHKLAVSAPFKPLTANDLKKAIDKKEEWYF